jgi:hypothetical protein
MESLIDCDAMTATPQARELSKKLEKSMSPALNFGGARRTGKSTTLRHVHGSGNSPTGGM